MITDNQAELFDVVNLQDEVIGKATRGEVHINKHLIHRSIYVAVFNTKKELFMQQRSETKDKDPLYWDISCAGHVGHSDTYIHAARREMEEELGVSLPLRFIKKYIARLPTETEMTTLYTAHFDGPFTLSPQEIKQGKYFSQMELLQSIKNEPIAVSECCLLGLHHLGFL